jgi:hypothetical protein
MDFGDLNFALSAATSPRTIASRFGVLTPYDFNPSGLDLAGGSADAGPSFQAMFDYAFGPQDSPHGPDAGYLNKPCYIPAGNYKTEQQLVLTNVDSAWIFGDGMDSTRVFYGGVVDGSGRGGATYTLCFQWMRTCLLQGFTVSGPPAAADPWTGAPVPFAALGGVGALDGNAGNHNLFVGMGFERGVDGAFLGWQASSLGSEFAFINCRLRNCKWGYRIVDNFNALDFSMWGGSIEDCEVGISALTGMFNIISGTMFIGCNVDIDSTTGNPTALIGVKSTSTGKHLAVGGPTYVCNGEFASIGHFADVEAPLVVDGSKIAGTISGTTSKIYLRGNDAPNAGLLTSWSGTTAENI